MPLGDSLTSGVDDVDNVGEGGYRAPLEDLLQNAGIWFDFVGYAPGGFGRGWGFIDDTDHQGYPGVSINGEPSGSTNKSLVAELRNDRSVASVDPDIILLLVGTNNLGPGVVPNAQQFGTDINALFREIVLQAPNAVVFVSSVPPTNPDSPITRASKTTIDSYNAIMQVKIADWQRTGFDMRYVDGGAAFTEPTTDINAVSPKTDPDTGSPAPDGVHPSSEGYAKLADVWFSRLERIAWDCYGLYAESATLGNGWRWSPLIGSFNDTNNTDAGWKYSPSIGWFFVPGNKTRDLWFYQGALGWTYTNPSVAPNLFINGVWEYFEDSPTAGARLYDYAAGAWRALPKP